MVANAELLRCLDPDSSCNGRYDSDNSDSHAQQALSEGVNIMAWRGNLIDSYIERKVGICAYRHAALPAFDCKGRDLAFVFQDEGISQNLELGEGCSSRDNEHRLDIGSP